MAESMVEVCARALAEQRIRHVRRFDTPPERLEEMLPAAVEYAWPEHVEQVQTVLKALRDQTCVYRQGREVVHELRGAPDDIWKTLLDAALTQDTEG